MNTTLHIAEYGTDLSSRSSGRRIRLSVESLAATGPAVLDFSGVESVTQSFAAELLAVLVQQKGEAWFRSSVRVQHHNPDIRLTLLDAIDQRLSGSPQQAAQACRTVARKQTQPA